VSGLCQCGCGERTNLAKRTRTNDGWVKGQPIRYLYGHHRRGRTGERASRWKGGRKNSNGYVMIFSPNHPNSMDGYVYEHRLVMERELGRYLTREEVVHHRNEVRDDNAPENLRLFPNQAEHMRFHMEQNKQTKVA
jgi:hypothetical protein